MYLGASVFTLDEGTWIPAKQRRSLVRQAHSYFAGAISSTVLIAAAVVTFVLLVSAQAFRAWPISGLGLSSGGGTVSVSSGRVVGGTSASDPHVVAAATKGEATIGGGAGRRTPGGAGAVGRQGGLGGSPGATAPRERPGSPSGGGGSSSPSRPSSTSVPSDGSGSPVTSGEAGGGGGGSGSSGGSASAGVTNSVENTANQVGSTVGGALGNTGATKITEGVVSGVAGPTSTVGHAADETTSAVGGLLHLHR